MMNKVVVAILISLAVIIGLTGFEYVESENNWSLEWEDDFNGEKLDSTVWSVMNRARDGGCRNYITSHKACYDISDGRLAIKAIKNTVDSNDTAQYLAGGIFTKFKKSFAPGRIEVKAKFNGSKGKTCGIWMLPFTPDNGWPADGEIDVMEHAAKIDYVTQTVHTSYTKADIMAMPQRYAKQKVKYENYNIYGVDILEDRVNFYINHEKTFTYPRIDSLSYKGQFPFYRDWYILLSTASRGPFDSVCTPLEFEIDWVRYYVAK